MELRSPFRLRNRLKRLGARAPIAACSRYVRDNLVNAGLPPHRAHVVHPIPPEQKRPLKRRPEARALLFVGSLLRGKGVDIAIDALATLPADITLTVIGDGPSRASLERRARALVPGRVRFEGQANGRAVVDAYDRASVVVVPSRWPEPFGMVGLEAMRRARPVVAANHGGIPEWAAGTAGARLFTPGDPKSLARGVLGLLEDPDAGGAALQHAQDKFPHARLFGELEALLGSVVGEAASAGRPSSRA